MNTLVRADQSLIRARPALVAGKYERMSADLFSFYRGTFALFLRDARDSTTPTTRSAFCNGGPLVDGIGDAHPENFGLLRASDGTFALEPNDFDGADRYPYLWDLRRLTTGLVIASRLSNPSDPSAQTVAASAAHESARLAAQAYADAMRDDSQSGVPARVTTDGGSAVLADLFRRAHRDDVERAELQDFTTLTGATRKLLRGPVDPTDPANTYAELPTWVISSLPAVLDDYRTTLESPPEKEYFRILDAVREFGSGVASWPRVRIILLLRGPSDDPSDDVMVELKELGDSSASGWFPPGIPADSVQDRVLRATRLAWSRPDADPLWGVSTWLGFPVQIRTESSAFKNVRVKRLEDDLGTPDAIAGLADALGRRLAAIHARSHIEDEHPAREIAERIQSHRDAFALEQADIAVELADGVANDWSLFRHALERLGPSLGVPLDNNDLADPSLRAVFGQPAP